MTARLRRLLTRPLPGGLVLLWLAPAAAHDLVAWFEHGAARFRRAAAGADVVRVDRAVRPGRVRWCRSARAVIEVRAGSAGAFRAALMTAGTPTAPPPPGRPSRAGGPAERERGDAGDHDRRP